MEEIKKIPVLAVVGPTASGKTKLAVRIAKRYGGEVISADSMQIYRGMDIATAKPTKEEMDGIPHHLIDFQDVSEPFSVVDYARMAHESIQDTAKRGKLPILAGGTGLYVDAVLNDIRFGEIEGDPAIREELAKFAKAHGNAALLQELRRFDPETAQTLHENDLGRIVRAVEVYRLTGITMSEYRKQSIRQSRYCVLKVGLSFRNRQLLYDRIDQRVDDMMARGLLEEAKSFYRAGSLPTAAQAIGYKELFAYFNKECSLSEATERLKKATRHYAKRQLTWFRKDPKTQWFYLDDEIAENQKNIVAGIDNFMKLCYDETGIFFRDLIKEENLFGA